MGKQSFHRAAALSIAWFVAGALGCDETGRPPDPQAEPAAAASGGGAEVTGVGGANGAATTGTGGGATSTSTSGSGATAPVEFAPGVFALQAADKPTDPSIYASADVAGAAVRVRWSTLEPSEGAFDWSFLDQEVQKAASAGKLVSVYLTNDLPSWVVEAGAQTFSFIDQNPNHPTYGEVLVMAVPYDPVFLAKWMAFVTAAGDRYANEPTLAYVRGASESVTHGWGLATTDADGNTWQAYGYTPEKLVASMEMVIDTFMAAFPATAQWVEVGPIKFEPDISGQPQTYVASTVAEYAFSTYPDRFGVWREDLTGCTPEAPTSAWKILWDHPGRGGAQMVWNVQDGPDRMNKCGITPNDKATVLQAAVQRGLDYGMPYLEIYNVDVIDRDLGPVVHFAHEELGK